MRRSTSPARTVVRSALLGFAGGLRSQMPLAALSVASRRDSQGESSTFIGHPLVTAGLCLAAAGEVVADKLPMTPSRLNPGSLGGRMTLGALAGGLLARRQRQPLVAGLVVGAAGALSGSFAGYHVRVRLPAATGVPDVVWAGIEDGVALLVARSAANR